MFDHIKKSIKKKGRKPPQNLTPKNKYSSTTPEFDQWLEQTLEEDKELIKELAKR